MNSTYLKGFFFNLCVYVFIWFFMTQVNAFAGWVALSFPIYWIFVFFPAMLLPSSLGLGVVVVFGIFFESQFPQFRGVFIPLFIGLFLILYYRRTRMFDQKYSVVLLMASFSHLVITLILSFWVSRNAGNHFFLRILQDWLSGQLFIFIALPFLWVVLSAIRGDNRQYGMISDLE